MPIVQPNAATTLSAIRAREPGGQRVEHAVPGETTMMKEVIKKARVTAGARRACMNKAAVRMPRQSKPAK